MSKKLWVGLFVGSLSLFLVGLLPLIVVMLSLGNKMSTGTGEILLMIAAFGAIQFVIVQTVYTFCLLAKMWGAIQDGQTEITVGKAIGFLFIPFFSIYWIFRAWGSFPTEYNNFIDRHGLNIPYLSTNVYLYYPLLMILAAVLPGPVLLLPFFFIAVISKTCDAINDLCDAFEEKQKAALLNPAINHNDKVSAPRQFLANV
jgi:hypothetical protein